MPTRVRAVRRDGESFHAFVCGAAAGVVVNFILADCTQFAHEQMRGKFEAPQTQTEDAIELIDVRSVFVGNINSETIVGKTDAFRIQSAIIGIAGVAVRIESVGTAGEEVLQKIVLRRHAGAYREVFTCAVNQRGQAEQQRGVPQFRRQGERQACAVVGFEIHCDGVEAWDVGDSVVDEGSKGTAFGPRSGSARKVLPEA